MLSKYTPERRQQDDIVSSKSEGPSSSDDSADSPQETNFEDERKLKKGETGPSLSEKPTLRSTVPAYAYLPQHGIKRHEG